jgi:hypothetical protein
VPTVSPGRADVGAAVAVTGPGGRAVRFDDRQNAPDLVGVGDRVGASARSMPLHGLLAGADRPG